MRTTLYLILGSFLILFAFIVFRRIVRRDYRLNGQLTVLASSLQLLVFVGYFSFPYLFNPPRWSWFWLLDGPTNPFFQIAGLTLVCLGFLAAFGTMAWFGMRKAFGMSVSGLVQGGPYRITRNPQILGGYLLVLGTALQWPSLYSIGWIILYGIITHWMVLTEEEHLATIFGDEYEQYCGEVPRYLFGGRRNPNYRR